MTMLTKVLKCYRLLDAQPQLLLASLKRNWPPVGSTYTCEKGNWIYLGRMWSHLPPPKKHRKVIGIQISTARQSYSFPVFLGPPIGVYPGLELSTDWINLGLEAKMASKTDPTCNCFMLKKSQN